MSPADAFGRARCSIPQVSPARAAVRRAGLDPMRPVLGPGTGPSSFLGRKDWKKPEYIIQYPAPAALAQEAWRHSAQIVHKNLSAASGPAFITSFFQLLGKEFTGCGPRKRPSVLQQLPRGRSGEKSFDPHGAGPGDQGSRPQLSLAVERLEKPDNALSIRPRRAPGKGFGAFPPTSLTTVCPEWAWN